MTTKAKLRSALREEVSAVLHALDNGKDMTKAQGELIRTLALAQIAEALTKLAAGCDGEALTVRTTAH